jgi:hypothetical protein
VSGALDCKSGQSMGGCIAAGAAIGAVSGLIPGGAGLLAKGAAKVLPVVMKAVAPLAKKAVGSLISKAAGYVERKLAEKAVPRLTAQLQGFAKKAADEYASGALQMTAKQAAAVARVMAKTGRDLEPMFRGFQIDQRAKQLALKAGLPKGVKVSMPGEAGPDFWQVVGKDSDPTGVWWDMTTEVSGQFTKLSTITLEFDSQYEAEMPRCRKPAGRVAPVTL